jgi:hypothetical protein
MVYDNSTDWASQLTVVVNVRFTITSLYDGADLTTTPTVIDIPIDGVIVTFEEGFEYEITAAQLYGLGFTGTVKDSIYRIAMTLYDVGGVIATVGYNFTSDEVFYFNAQTVLDEYVAGKASYIDTMDWEDKDYANWLDTLITTIESNTRFGNSSAIYYVFDIFSRL